MFFSQLQEANEIPFAVLEIKPASFQLMMIPKDIDPNRIESQCLDHQDAMLPVLPRHAAEVHFSSMNGQVLLNSVVLFLPCDDRRWYYSQLINSKRSDSDGDHKQRSEEKTVGSLWAWVYCWLILVFHYINCLFLPKMHTHIIYSLIIMLLPYLKALESKIVVLGSQSKSRNELMTAQGIKYKVIPSKFPEDLEHASYDHPKDYNLVRVFGLRTPAGERSKS